MNLGADIGKAVKVARKVAGHVGDVVGVVEKVEEAAGEIKRKRRPDFRKKRTWFALAGGIGAGGAVVAEALGYEAVGGVLRVVGALFGGF